VNREPQSCLLVDNLVYSFAANPDTGLLIKPYLGTSDRDDELLYLADALERWDQDTPASRFLEQHFGQKDFFGRVRSSQH